MAKTLFEGDEGSCGGGFGGLVDERRFSSSKELKLPLLFLLLFASKLLLFLLFVLFVK